MIHASELPFGPARLRAIAALLISCFASNALAQSTPTAVRPDGYVRLDVRLLTSGETSEVSFDFCPKEKLWEVDIGDLLKGARQVNLGVGISGPLVPPFSLTPMTIARKKSGILGLGKSCSVKIDQIVYRSPAVSVRRHNGSSFAVSPTYNRLTSVNPGVGTTVTTALGFASKLIGVPAETAAPFQSQITTLLSSINVSNVQTITRYLQILPGITPEPLSWRAPGAIEATKDRAARDLLLVAQLVPVDSLILEPDVAAGGASAWTSTAVLSSPFPELAPGLNPSQTLRGHVATIASTDLNNFRSATNALAASIACDSMKGKIDGIGLSLRDTALLMWAIAHDTAPVAPVTAYDIDQLVCLKDAWATLPVSIAVTRIVQPPAPPPAAASPPTVRQMQSATQIDEAFARFFVVGTWTERKRFAESLFAYPVAFDDSKVVLYPSRTLANSAEWLELHRNDSPLASRVGCYTYVSSAKAGEKSLLYAIAELPDNGKEVAVTATFANGAKDSDARIDGLILKDALDDATRNLMRAAQSNNRCSSGYAPKLLFGG